MMIRPGEPSDLDAIVELCAEHAAFEKAEYSAEYGRRNLPRFLFSQPPRAWCLVADANGPLAGYASYSLEFSTWSAAEYVHMDCLFVRDAYRNRGIGAQFLRHIVNAARALGCDCIEWQTPSWNTDAMRFYEREGGVGWAKMRYRLPL